MGGVWEFDAGLECEQLEFVAECFEELAVECLAILKAHFAFIGVDVDIDECGWEFEEEEADGMSADHEQSAVGFGECVLEAAILDPAAVEKEELMAAGGAAESRFADVAPESNGGAVGERGFGGDGDEVIGDFGAEETANAVERIVGSREFVDEFFVMSEDHVESRVGERDAGELFDDVSEFCGGFFEETAAGRGIEEEVVDFHDSAGGAAAVAVVDDPTAVAFEFAADGAVFGSSANAKLGDGGDGGECFTAEAEGADVVEVGVRANFAGGMAGDSQQHVFRMNAFAIVGDADEFHSTALNVDVDASGEGIDAVFEQFFNDAAGSFDDFASGDAINDMCVELLDACHAWTTWVACTEEIDRRDYSIPHQKNRGTLGVMGVKLVVFVWGNGATALDGNKCEFVPVVTNFRIGLYRRHGGCRFGGGEPVFLPEFFCWNRDQPWKHRRQSRQVDRTF